MMFYDDLCLESILGFFFWGVYLPSFSGHFYFAHYCDQYDEEISAVMMKFVVDDEDDNNGRFVSTGFIRHMTN